MVHDFGAPIGLDFAMRHPEMIARLVILNSWLWSSRFDPEFARLSKLLSSPLLPFLYRYLNFSARYMLPRSFGDRKLGKHQLKHYTKPFADKTQRYGPLAFARSLLTDQEWFQALWEKKQAIADKPTLFIWGMKDPIIKPHYLDIFKSGFPNSETFRLETAGHFPQEEQPQLVSDAMLSFLGEDRHRR